jgi:hypothetical protein
MLQAIYWICADELAVVEVVCAQRKWPHDGICDTM